MTLPGKSQLQELLYYMTLSRRLELAIAGLHLQGRVPGPLLLRPGLEAIAVGSAFVPTSADSFCSSLGSLGSLLLRGVDPLEILEHYLGTVTSISKGRAGLSHFGDAKRGLIPAAGHAATHLSVMAGVAFAFQIRKEERVAVTLLSEEALATGDFHEGINFAAVKHLPLVVLVVRNEASVASATLPAGTGVAQVYERARGYGIQSVPLDGGDMSQVIQIMGSAIKRARNGGGPTLVEATVRSAQRYHANESAVPPPFIGLELGATGDALTASDPLVRFEAHLREMNCLDSATKTDLLRRAETTVVEALGKAERRSMPPPEKGEELVFAAPDIEVVP